MRSFPIILAFLFSVLVYGPVMAENGVAPEASPVPVATEKAPAPEISTAEAEEPIDTVSEGSQAEGTQEDIPAEPGEEDTGFDFNLLWKGALAGLVLVLFRFFSKQGLKLKNFDWKYVAVYSGVGILGGVYCALRGLNFENWYDYAEGAGLVALIYHLLKGGAITGADIIKLLKILTQKPEKTNEK